MSSQYSIRKDILKKSLIFSGLDEGELAGLAGLTVERSFKPDQFVLWEGDAPDHFYLIVEGRIKILKHSSSGKALSRCHSPFKRRISSRNLI